MTYDMYVKVKENTVLKTIDLLLEVFSNPRRKHSIVYHSVGRLRKFII